MLCRPCIDYLESCFQPGADPGLCICTQEQVTQEMLLFGCKAETTLLNKKEALELAAKHAVFLQEIGGDGEGVIGALAAVGLRAGGNNGRLVDARGIRDIKGIVSVAEIKQRTDIGSVRDIGGNLLGDDEMIDSLEWIRPSLIGGKAVLRVKRAPGAARKIWVPAEKRLKAEH
jgi:hypothetical protein